jgi:hypothetical protein
MHRVLGGAHTDSRCTTSDLKLIPLPYTQRKREVIARRGGERRERGGGTERERGGKGRGQGGREFQVIISENSGGGEREGEIMKILKTNTSPSGGANESFLGSSVPAFPRLHTHTHTHTRTQTHTYYITLYIYILYVNI